MSRLLSCLVVVLAVWGSCHTLPWGDEGNAWERSGKFQGDIIFADRLYPRNGLRDPIYRWPGRTLVYRIAPNSFSAAQVQAIEEALYQFEKLTCVRFREAMRGDYDYVLVTGHPIGCYSFVGRVGGPQRLNLGSSCFTRGAIIHEFLHALGFMHQQSATDRDDFVKIMWENIMAGQEHNFEKYPVEFHTDFGVPYDYESIMHYSRKAFSRNGKDTIVPIDPTAVIGQQDSLSDKDIEKLEIMYGCQK